MKFKIKLNVDWINISPFMGGTDDDKQNFNNYIIRAIGFEAYRYKLLTNLPANANLEKLVKEFTGALDGVFINIYPCIQSYYTILYDKIGCPAEEASVETWDQFKGIIETILESIYDLYEMDRYNALLDNAVIRV